VGTAAPWGWAGAGAVLGLLLALALFAPARWLQGWLAQVSGGRVQLMQPSGTVWHGAAGLMLTGGPGSADLTTLPGRVRWQLRPTLDAQGAALELRLSADCCLQQPWLWRLSPGWGSARLTVADSVSHWPVQLLGGLGTPWNTVALQGRLALRTRTLDVTWAHGRTQWGGAAELDALELSSRLSTLRPLGSYRLTLAGGTGSTLTLATLTGALHLSGQGQWVGGRLHFVGEASSAPDAQAALANLLNIIGRRQGARSLITLG